MRVQLDVDVTLTAFYANELYANELVLCLTAT